MAVSDDRAEAAVLFLRDTAQEYGQLRGRVAYAESNLRRVKALAMLGQDMTSTTQGHRETLAYASAEYLAAIEEHQNAVADYETLRAKREAAVMTVEVWRSQNATKRQGL